MTIVYRASTKALRRKVMVPQDRIILLPKIIPEIFPLYGLAMLYQRCDFECSLGSIKGGAVLDGFAPYKTKDSHLILAREDLPAELYLSADDAMFIANYGIEVPIKNLIVVLDWMPFEPQQSKPVLVPA